MCVIITENLLYTHYNNDFILPIHGNIGYRLLNSNYSISTLYSHFLIYISCIVSITFSRAYSLCLYRSKTYEFCR